MGTNHSARSNPICKANEPTIKGAAKEPKAPIPSTMGIPAAARPFNLLAPIAYVVADCADIKKAIIKYDTYNRKNVLENKIAIKKSIEDP